jgi:shikimate dehydrogenase
VKAPPGRLVLLGHPVAHSLSPRFQNAALRAAGISINYEALDVPPADLPRTLDGLRSIAGAGNVTVPHKRAVAAQCDELTALARRADAVNTFWCEDGRLIGDNTDVGGFQAAVIELLAGSKTSRPRTIAVLGAGGAGAAVLAAIEQWPEARARVFSRSLRRADALCARFADVARAVSSAEEAVRGADLVVNATPIGLADGHMPVDPRHLEEGTAVLDLVYGRGGTPWTRAAERLGLRARDGTGMLIEQGALAFERWFGVSPDRAVMREAVPR